MPVQELTKAILQVIRLTLKTSRVNSTYPNLRLHLVCFKIYKTDLIIHNSKGLEMKRQKSKIYRRN